MPVTLRSGTFDVGGDGFDRGEGVTLDDGSERVFLEGALGALTVKGRDASPLIVRSLDRKIKTPVLF